MTDIVVDSGPLIPLFDGSDAYHERAVAFMKGLTGTLVTNFPVVTEVASMLDFSTRAQRDFLSWAEQALTIDTGTRADFPRFRTILEKYVDLSADFAHASLVALCARLYTTTVASIDADFTI